MKIGYLVIGLAFLFSSCDRNSCPMEILEFEFDEISVNLFSESYIDQDSIIFENENGSQRVFTGKFKFQREQTIFNKVCDDDNFQKVTANYDNLSAWYSSIDSFELSFILLQFPNGCNWENNMNLSIGDKLGVSMYDRRSVAINTGGVQQVIGSIDRVLKFPETEVGNSICTNNWEEINNLNLVGHEYTNVTSSPLLINNNGAIYFKDGIGLIGYTDNEGIDWRIKM